jgi:hypothetical protein
MMNTIHPLSVRRLVAIPRPHLPHSRHLVPNGVKRFRDFIDSRQCGDKIIRFSTGIISILSRFTLFSSWIEIVVLFVSSILNIRQPVCAAVFNRRYAGLSIQEQQRCFFLTNGVTSAAMVIRRISQMKNIIDIA